MGLREWIHRLSAPPRRRARLSYDAAGRPYWDAGRGRAASGPNSAALPALPTLRARVRYLVRNNPHARQGIAKLVRGIVGTGLSPIFADAGVQALFDRWARQSWAGYPNLGLYALQEAACRAWIEGGEVLARKRWRSMDYGYAVPLQVEVLEGDYLDDSRGLVITPAGTRRTAYGIEFDAVGDPSAYYLLPYHPADTLIGLSPLGSAQPSRAIPAADIAHLYTVERPGQIRGIPHFASIIEAVDQIADLRLAQRLNMQTRSRIVGGIESESEDFPGGLSGTAEESDETPDREVLEDLGPAAFVRLLKGETLTWGPGLTIGTDYEPTMVTEDRRVAAGMGLTYEQMSGNLSTVNYSSYRAGLNDARDERRGQRENIFLPALMDPIIRWFLDAAVVAGKIRTADVPYTWSSPRVLVVDGEQAKVDRSYWEIGAKSEVEIIEAGGRPWRDVLRERAEYRAECERLGLPAMVPSTVPALPEPEPGMEPAPAP